MWPLDRGILQERVLDATPYIPGVRYRPELRQLIARMFAKNPRDRPTAVEIIATPWLQEYDRSKLKASVLRHACTTLKDELSVLVRPDS